MLEMKSLGLALGLVAVGSLAFLAPGCGSSGGGFGGGFDSGADGSSGDATLTDGGSKKDTGGVMKLGGDSGGTKCVPSTCAELDHANCGPVSDPKCGGVVQCGKCSTGETCGGGGPNKCGAGTTVDAAGGCTEASVKMTCASQAITCGAAGDGCGGTLSCGSCNLPLTCGGDPAHPGQCGCTGVCAQVPVCQTDAGADAAGATTTLTGKVLDPAAKFGLYNALVYIPNDPTDPGLQPFPPGITCDVCGSTAAGDPLVTTKTAPDGTFSLSGVPVGASIPLVIQLGRWRRQFTIPITNACGANAVPASTVLSMPQNHSQGDLPRIAFVTGALDPVECLFPKIGVDASEFTNAGGGGYFQFFTGDEDGTFQFEGQTYPYSVYNGSGATLGSGTPTQDNLFAATGGPNGTPYINNFDMVIMECEGYEQPEASAQETALAAYAAAGGRVFASDFQYTWMYESAPPSGWAAAFPGVANWNGNHLGCGYDVVAGIEPASVNPDGPAFQAWLTNAGVAGASTGSLSITPAFPNATSVIAPTQEWLLTNTSEYSQSECGGTHVPDPIPVHFTFNAPVGSTVPASQQCGRVTYSDWHAEQPTLTVHNATFPAECDSAALTTQQTILEFMLFDLSACVTPYTPLCTPTTCATLGVQCGPASDGCGNLLECGSCGTGQTCGGGGAGKCGTTTVNCVPETCTSQHIECGPAGDGCGNEIQCGNCPTGDVCGLNSPGQCGMTSK